MDKRQIKERKKYLALQAFYLKMKELIKELEERLEIDTEPRKVVRFRRVK